VNHLTTLPAGGDGSLTQTISTANLNLDDMPQTQTNQIVHDYKTNGNILYDPVHNNQLKSLNDKTIPLP
jgi:hypothetical protein